MRFAFLASCIVGLFAPVSAVTAGAMGSIYVTEFFDGVSQVDPVTGTVTPLFASGEIGDSGPIALDHSGKLLVTDELGILRIDPMTLTQSLIPTRSFTSARGMAVERDGNILVAATDSLVRVNAATGDVTTLRSGSFISPRDVIVGPTGDIYLSDFFNGVARIDPVTGAPTEVPGDSIFAPGGIAFDNEGKLLATDASRGLVRIDLGTGEQTIVSNGTFTTSTSHLAVEEDGNILLASVFDDLIRIDPATGLATNLVTQSFFSPRDMLLVRTDLAVPEPNSFAIFASGALMIVGCRRRLDASAAKVDPTVN